MANTVKIANFTVLNLYITKFIESGYFRVNERLQPVKSTVPNFNNHEFDHISSEMPPVK